MAELTKLQQALYAEIQHITKTQRGTPNVIYDSASKRFSRRRGSQYSAGTFRGLIKAGLMVQVSDDKYSLPEVNTGKAQAALESASSTDWKWLDDAIASDPDNPVNLKRENDRLRAALEKIYEIAAYRDFAPGRREEIRSIAKRALAEPESVEG